jgi:ankyrin repeat protein
MSPEETIANALCKDDAKLLRETFAMHPELKARINEPLGPFDSPLVNSARSREMLDALLDAGADINARSRWWAGSYGILDTAGDDLAHYAIQRGAKVNIHSAARLGLIDRVREFVTNNPESVRSPGPDGQTPLHLAKTVEIAELLLNHGADINARDIDHESTPVQYMTADRQEVARFLVQRGCGTDIFIAAALGDALLAQKHLALDPNCVRMRVNDDFFPKRNPHAGGTIYQWTLGFHVSPHEVAKRFGHEELYQLLMTQSPAEVRLINACWAGDELEMRRALATNPHLAPTDHQQLAHAARNNSLDAVRLMLIAGFPTNVYGQHHATPLHWAAWHGNAEMAALLLKHGPPLEDATNEFKGTPLGWAIHGSENGWHCKTGSYGPTVQALLNAGARIPSRINGTAEVQKVIEAHRSKKGG